MSSPTRSGADEPPRLWGTPSPSSIPEALERSKNRLCRASQRPNEALERVDPLHFAEPHQPLDPATEF